MLTWVVDAGSQFTSVGHGGGLNECRVTDNVSSSSPCRQTGKGRKEGRKEPTPPIKKNNSIPKSSTVQNHFLSNTIAASVACAFGPNCEQNLDDRVQLWIQEIF
jgi:hypothetical protein